MLQRPSHRGLRHLALGVRDLDAMKRFYVALLGFGVEWAPDARAGAVLDHFGLIVRSAADVDAWAAFLESRGVTIDAQPRTHRDGARSCYFKDPDGNSIQIIHHPPISEKV